MTGQVFTNLFLTFWGEGTGKFSTTPITQQNVILDNSSAGAPYSNCAISDMAGGNSFLDGQFSLLVTSSCYGPNETNNGNLPGTTSLARGEGNGQFLLNQSHTQPVPHPASAGDRLTADVHQSLRHHPQCRRHRPGWQHHRHPRLRR